MDTFGICLQTLIPLRSEPSESAELETQILFGELYSVKEQTEKWVLICLESDKQEGWIDRKLLVRIDDKQKESLKNSKKIIISEPITIASKNEEPLILVAGSTFYYNQQDSFIFNDVKYCINNQPANNDIIETAKKFINSPYLWGGKSALGIDCSGFSQVVFKTLGVQLPRNASQQVNLGETIQFIDQAQKGDLAFFGNEEEKITHVGIIIDKNTIIHASGWVRIDSIDHNGILKKETNEYSHKLRIIKRIKKADNE